MTNEAEIPKFKSDKEEAEYWDKHSMAEHFDTVEPLNAKRPDSAKLTDKEIHQFYDHWNPLPSRLDSITLKQLEHRIFRAIADAATEKTWPIAYKQGYKDRDSEVTKEKEEFGLSVGDAFFEQGQVEERQKIGKALATALYHFNSYGRVQIIVENLKQGLPIEGEGE